MLRGLRIVSVSWAIVNVNVSWTLQWQEVRTAMFIRNVDINDGSRYEDNP